MDFSDALKVLYEGKKIQRDGWNGKDMWIRIIRGSDPTVTTGDYQINQNIWKGECLQFIAMKTADNKLVPWLASQTDILANDWQIV